jgi:hypothetical protein
MWEHGGPYVQVDRCHSITKGEWIVFLLGLLIAARTSCSPRPEWSRSQWDTPKTDNLFLGQPSFGRFMT